MKRKNKKIGTGSLFVGNVTEKPLLMVKDSFVQKCSFFPMQFANFFCIPCSEKLLNITEK